jgi:hypothetical protein
MVSRNHGSDVNTACERLHLNRGAGLLDHTRARGRILTDFATLPAEFHNANVSQVIYSGLALDLPDCKGESCHCFNAVLGVQAVLWTGAQALLRIGAPLSVRRSCHCFATVLGR